MNQDGHSESARFFVTRQPSAELWDKLRGMLEEREDRQLEAVGMILSNLRQLPESADERLLALSQSGSVKVKRAIAERLSTERMPWALQHRLLQALSKDPDSEVQRLIAPLLEPYRKMADAVVAYYERILRPARDDLVRGAPQIAASGRISRLLEDLRKSLRDLSFGTTASQQYLANIYRLSEINDSIVRDLARLPASYYPSGLQQPKAQEGPHELIDKIRGLPPGLDTWVAYQQTCEQILTYCFVPPLLPPQTEAPTMEGIHRRDLVYHVPHDAGGFWNHLRLAYHALAVIVDAKNYTSRLPKDQVVLQSKYFGEKKLGQFGMIMTRMGLDDSGRREQMDRWVHHDEMIVCMADADLIEMIERRRCGESPEIVIDRQIRDVRSTI